MKRLLILGCALALAACHGNSDAQKSKAEEAAQLNIEMGINYYRKGDTDLAIDKLKRSVEQAPDMALAHSSLALVYARAGRIEAADKEYRKALSLDSAGGEIENNYGVFLCEQGRASDAEKHFLRAVQDKHYGTPEAAWTNAGVCLRKASPDKAERYFRAALETNREFPDALANLAFLSTQKQDYLRARAFLQRYELVGPVTAETLWVGAKSERALGDASAALRYEARLKADFPNSEEASTLKQ